MGRGIGVRGGSRSGAEPRISSATASAADSPTDVSDPGSCVVDRRRRWDTSEPPSNSLKRNLRQDIAEAQVIVVIPMAVGLVVHAWREDRVDHLPRTPDR